LTPPRVRWQWPSALAACVAAAGLASVRLGLDVNWDLRNYHYYDAYAFLTGRLGWDVAPAQIQTFHNPLLDLVFYALVQQIASPRVIAFAMAVPAGIAAFLLLRLLVRLFPSGLPDRALWIAAAFAIGVTGASSQAMLGCTMNEWPPAMLLMVALLFLCHARQDGGPTNARERSGWIPAFAGMTAGMAVGLKLTYGVFAFGLLAATLLDAPWREALRRTALLGAGMALGFALTYGFWGVTLWREFANPFFPYFNNVFASPWWEPVAWFDRNWGPRNALQWVLFPFYFARESKLVGEVSFRDYRLAALLALALMLLVAKGTSRAARLAPPWRFPAVFTLASYVAWIFLFGIYRYLVPLELLSGPLIVAACLALVGGRNARRAAIVVVAVLLVGTTRPASWGRIPFHGAYFDVAAPDLAPNALVIVGPYDPLAYAIPYFRPDARFVSPQNNLLHWSQRNLLVKRIDALVAGHEGPLYALDLRGYDRLGDVLDHYRLSRDLSKCLPVRSNLDFGLLQVCPLERKPL